MKKKFLKTLSALAIAAVLALNVTVVLDDNATSYLEFGAIGKILAQTGASPSSITHSDDSSAWGDWWDDLWNLDWEQDYVDCCTYSLTEIKGGYSGSISVDAKTGVVTGSSGWESYYKVEEKQSGQRVDCLSGNNDTCTEYACAEGGDC